MHFSAPFIRRPVATFLMSWAVILAGAVAYKLLPVASLPQVEFPVISVGASLPGADPETMASSVATPLERQFSKIAGINEMTSYSSTGSTGIVLQFDLSRDINGAARDVQAAINAARSQLPANLPSNPGYYKVNPGDSPIMILALTSDTNGPTVNAGSGSAAQPGVAGGGSTATPNAGAGSGHGIVRIRDVAKVVDSVENVQAAGVFNGKPAIVVLVFKTSTANVIETVDNVKKMLPMLQASIPPAIQVHVAMDRTTTIRASVRDVTRTLVISILLVIMVVFLFLREVRSTLIPTVAVPLSLLGT